jgi:cell division transport system permease protein
MDSSGIIPLTAPPMRTLTLAMTVMCYLATLALGALMLVEAAVSQWTSGVSAEVTVQVRPQPGGNLESEVDKALAILEGSPGVASVRRLSATDMRRLLEPWLGGASQVERLPIPALIAVTIDRASPPDLALLEEALTREVQGVSMDTHRRWQAELMRTATTMRHLSFAVLALIAVSASGLVVFATRSVLDANRAVIDLLHLVGARDGFIAGAVKGRFFRTGLVSGLLGTLAGIMTFAVLGMSGSPAGGDGVAEASARLLLSTPTISIATYSVFLTVPIVATLLSVATAHAAVVRQLRQESPA